MDDSFATGYALGNDNNGNRNDGGMFGGEGFMFLIVILALMGGNGFGGLGGGRASDALTRSDMCEGFNFQNLENGVRGVQNGLCDGFYAQNSAIMNGFHGVDNAICNLGYQAQQCCCETNRNIDSVRYENAKNTCDIIQAGHTDADRIIGFLTNDKIEGLRDRAMQAEAQLSQMAQSRFIVDQVRPCPVPSYITCNPWGNTYGYNSGIPNGCGSGCGCGM